MIVSEGEAKKAWSLKMALYTEAHETPEVVPHHMQKERSLLVMPLRFLRPGQKLFWKTAGHECVHHII